MKRQTGVALITAILITAIASIAAVAMASRQHMDIRRTTNILDAEQTYLFALGAESYARDILFADKKNTTIDNLQEDWATEIPPIPVEGAVLAGNIEDLQGRYNLNNLVDNKGVKSQVDVTQFEQLLENVGLKRELAMAVLDWIDKDTNAEYGGGAEDNEYLGSDRPYRTPNSFMASASELLLIKGFTQQHYDALAPYVIALPEKTKININTADAYVMAAILNIDKPKADQIVEKREETPFNTMNDLTGLPLMSGVNIAQALPVLDVSSDYFMLNAEVTFGNSHARLQSIFSRKAAPDVKVIRRAQGAI